VPATFTPLSHVKLSLTDAIPMTIVRKAGINHSRALLKALLDTLNRTARTCCQTDDLGRS
jgi:hypothetical protein